MEIAANLYDHLTSGLVPLDTKVVNAPYWSTLTNVRVKDNVLTTHYSPTPTITDTALTAAGITKSYPFPQLITLKSINLLCCETSIYTVSNTGVIGSALTFYNLSDEVVTISSGGGVWEAAEYQDVVYLTNGQTLIWKTSWNTAAHWYLTESGPVPSTIVRDRMRVVMGGFADTFWSSEWQSLWTTWMATLPTTAFPLTQPGMNGLVWSTLGHGIMPFLSVDDAVSGIDDPTISAQAGYTINTPASYFELLRASNGISTTRTSGDVYTIKRLGDSLVVYGSEGVEIMSAVAEPIPTYSFSESVLDTPAASRASVCEGRLENIMVAEDGTIYSITNQGPTKLGFSSYIAPLLDSTFAILYNKVEREYYLQNSMASYCLRDGNLSKMDKIVYATSAKLGDIYTEESSSDVFEAVTSWMNFGVQDIKQLRVVELSTEGIEDLRVGVDVKVNLSGSTIEGSYVYGSPEAVFWPNISGAELRIKLTGTLSEGASIYGFKVRYVNTSYRSVRGPRTTALDGQGGSSSEE